MARMIPATDEELRAWAEGPKMQGDDAIAAGVLRLLNERSTPSEDEARERLKAWCDEADAAGVRTIMSPTSLVRALLAREEALVGALRKAHAGLDHLGVITHVGPDQGEQGPVTRLSLAERIALLQPEVKP